MTPEMRQLLKAEINRRVSEKFFIVDTKGRRQLKKMWRDKPGDGHRVMGEINHGSSHAYKHYGCRCRTCCDAMTLRAREQRLRRLERDHETA